MSTTKTAAFDWGNFAGSAGLGALAGGAGMGLGSYFQNPEGETPEQKKQRVINSSVMGAGLGGVAGGAINAIPTLLNSGPKAPTGWHAALNNIFKGSPLHNLPGADGVLPGDDYWKNHPYPRYTDNALGTGAVVTGLHSAKRAVSDGLLPDVLKTYKKFTNVSTGVPKASDIVAGTHGGEDVRGITNTLTKAYGRNKVVSYDDLMNTINHFGDGKGTGNGPIHGGVYESALSDVMRKMNVTNYPQIQALQKLVATHPTINTNVPDLRDVIAQVRAAKAATSANQVHLNQLMASSQGVTPGHMKGLWSNLTEGHGLTAADGGIMNHSSPARSGIAATVLAGLAQAPLNLWDNNTNQQDR